MALKKRREKWVTHKTEEGGTIVTFVRWCCDIDITCFSNFESCFGMINF